MWSSGDVSNHLEASGDIWAIWCNLAANGAICKQSSPGRTYCLQSILGISGAIFGDLEPSGAYGPIWDKLCAPGYMRPYMHVHASWNNVQTNQRARRKTAGLSLNMSARAGKVTI